MVWEDGGGDPASYPIVGATAHSGRRRRICRATALYSNRHAIGLTACAAATAVQRRSRYCTTRNGVPLTKPRIFSAS